ncbi:hypothetical protein NQD34_002937 [Periophthalmus magnuspinnatus]|nr:hypothetical protein NQD34_002937 [Periophthalmus magnuspinnatus]
MELREKRRRLRAQVTERLTAAADEIFALFERTIAEYEEELSRSKEENQRKQRLLDSALSAHTHARSAGVKIQAESPEEAQHEQKHESAAIKEEPEEPEELCFVQPVSVKNEELPQTELKDEPRGEHSGGADADFTQGPFLLQAMDRSKVWTKLWEPPAQMETEAPGDHYTQDYDRDYTQDYARDHSQRNDTSPNAHNPGLYSKYTCGANVEGALARTAGGGGGGGGGETRAAVREGQINDTSLTSHNSGGGKRGGRGETRATASEGQIKDTSPAALNSKCPSENVLYLGSAKVHVCVFCEKRFSTNQSLQIHIRVNTGEKPYSCPVCGKCFTQKAHLKTHIRTHTKERPYRCSICFKSFMHKVSLNLHMEKTHPEQVG